jgi:hypothetical protein
MQPNPVVLKLIPLNGWREGKKRGAEGKQREVKGITALI